MSSAFESNREPHPPLDSDVEIIADTRRWLEKAVIGLGFCPFAAHAHLRNQIRYRVSTRQSTGGLLQDLAEELHSLQAADPQLCETSLLIHPQVLADFTDYNEFLNEADATIREMDLEGELQIASFHPLYRYAGNATDDIENYSNRSPYPMLHLLREASVTRAIRTFQGVDAITDRNKATLRRLGREGWQRLWRE